MRLVFSIACLATLAATSVSAHDGDGQYDRLYYQRTQIQSLSTQLELNVNQFVDGATAAAWNRWDRDDWRRRDDWRGRQGRYRENRIDPSQQYALQLATQLQLAARTFSRYQTNLNSCGPYERNNGMCDRSFFTEISLFRRVRESFEALQSRAFELNFVRSGQGQFALQQISSALMGLNQIYRSIQDGPRPPAPMPVPPPPPRQNYPTPGYPPAPYYPAPAPQPPLPPGGHRAVPVNPSQVPPAPQPGYGNSRF